MEIVSNGLLLRKFRNIKEFTMDLGISKSSEIKKEGNKGMGQMTINIKDPFIFKYSNEKGRYIVKSGNIGTLGFYTDNLIQGYDYYIYDKNKEYKFTYVDNGDIREYLSGILDKVLNEDIEPNVLDVNMEDKIEYKLDKNLPKDKFIEEYMKINKKLGKV